MRAHQAGYEVSGERLKFPPVCGLCTSRGDCQTATRISRVAYFTRLMVPVCVVAAYHVLHVVAVESATKSVCVCVCACLCVCECACVRLSM